MPEPRTALPMTIERYCFRGFHGFESWCRLEILSAKDGRVVVIATELKDNPGTSVTNAFEIIANSVCRNFGIDPKTLVWIEHYAYPSAVEAGNPRPYDLVEFTLTNVDRQSVERPQWRRMNDADWSALGLAPRTPVDYR